jgi:hypothetical protein
MGRQAPLSEACRSTGNPPFAEACGRPPFVPQEPSVSGFPSPAWMSEFQKTINNDEELALIGRWFTTSFLFEAGDTRVVFAVESGKLVQVIPEPRFDQGWSFALRAPVEHWRKFIQPLPPYMFETG